MSSMHGKVGNGNLSTLKLTRRPSCEDEEVGEALIQLAVRTSAIETFPSENVASYRQKSQSLGPLSGSVMDQCFSPQYYGRDHTGHRRENDVGKANSYKPTTSQRFVIDSVQPNDELETHFENRVGKNNAKRKQISSMRNPKLAQNAADVRKPASKPKEKKELKKEKKHGRSTIEKQADTISNVSEKRKRQNDCLQLGATQDTPRKKSKELIQQQRLRALDALRNATDLVSMETALNLVNELDATDGSDAERLIQQASVAVPYMLHKTLVELTTRGSPDGPALSKRSANTVSSALVEKIGTSSCFVNVSEEVLVERGGLRAVDARRILPFLTRMGIENLEKARQIRKAIECGPEEMPGANSVGEVVTMRLKHRRKRKKAYQKLDLHSSLANRG